MEMQYRARTIDNKYWVYGSLLELPERGYIIPDDINNILLGPDIGQYKQTMRVPIISSTISQKSNKTDRNGKYIYSGMEIQVNGRNTHYAKFDNGIFKLCEEDGNNFLNIDGISSNEIFIAEKMSPPAPLFKYNIPYIICAAIWKKTEEQFEHSPKNIKNGLVISGRRHHNCYTIIYQLRSPLNLKRYETIDGFLTSDDRFVDRKEAAQIAYDAGQVWDKPKMLFSEDIY